MFLLFSQLLCMFMKHPKQNLFDNINVRVGIALLNESIEIVTTLVFPFIDKNLIIIIIELENTVPMKA